MSKELKTESEESNRMWASASFVGVLIIIGLPLWWKTTEVYRVALPYEKINSFADLPLTVATELTIFAEDDHTADRVAEVVEKAFEGSNVIKLKVKKAVISIDFQRALELAANEEVAAATVVDLQGPNGFYLVQRKTLPEDAWLGMERVLFFRDVKSALVAVQALEEWVYETKVLSGASADQPDAARRLRIPPAARYQLVLSVVHPAPEKVTVDFNAADAIEDYIGTFVDELSMIHNFTLKSQWLHLLDFNFEAKEGTDSNGQKYLGVSRARLQRLLTRLEERAASPASATPTLHLALYLQYQHAPLVILDDYDMPIQAPVQALMSPQWGGVVLSSPAPDVKLVMGTFLAQLRELIGITKTRPIPGAHLEPLKSTLPRHWETDRLLRLRTVEQLASARRTLASLARLLGEISNIVITDEVGASINSAVEGIAKGEALAASGDLLEAYRTSQQAHLAAETAFMDPSLLALLYFPDDQKYAIYIPLFLPIMFPVVLSLKNLVLWFRGKAVHKDKTE